MISKKTRWRSLYFIVSFVILVVFLPPSHAQQGSTEYLLKKHSPIFIYALDVMRWIDLIESDTDVAGNFFDEKVNKKLAFQTKVDRKIKIIDLIEYKGITIVKVKNTNKKGEAWTIKENCLEKTNLIK